MTESWLPIHTQRLLLRDFRETDFDDVHAYGSDPEVACFMDWGPNTLDDTREALAKALADQAASPRTEFLLAIEHLAEGRVIGSVALHWRDWPHRTVELGYCLRREGCFRRDRQIKGEWRDTYLYAVLGEDWLSP